MKILSWNVNGLRSVHKRNFLDWLEKESAEIICLQEIKAQAQQLPKELLKPAGYHLCINPATKRGYSGVAVYSRGKPQEVYSKLEHGQFDKEGRFLHLVFSHFSLINIYIPHGGRNKENLKYKLQTYESLFNYLKSFEGKPVILMGDFNIAHKELDLARPDRNRNNIMFTPEERKQIDRLLDLGFLDSFRQFAKDTGHFTWWPYRNNLRQRNIGWRIDYGFVSHKLRSNLKDAFILKEVLGSDHCPIGLEIF